MKSAQGNSNGDGDEMSELSILESKLHEMQYHPDYEYETTDGPRKAWEFEDEPPEGKGWTRNVHKADNGWERFDYHEEAYWMRKVDDS